MSASITTINGTIASPSTASTNIAPASSGNTSFVAPSTGPQAATGAVPGSGVSALVDLFSSYSKPGARNLYLAHVKIPPLDSNLDEDDD